MERYLRGCRGARRTRVRVVREPDEFLSLEDERRFHEEEGNDSNNENSASEVSETDGIPDSAFISGIAVERLKLPVWYSKFYESLLYPPTELKSESKESKEIGAGTGTGIMWNGTGSELRP